MKILTCLVATVTICRLGSFTSADKNDAGGTMTLVSLGTVDGKTFFAEDTPRRTWAEAAAACNATGMKLAKITSPAQAALLKNAYNETTFSDLHWTAGRDSLTLQQFVWDDDRTTPNHTFLAFRNGLSMNGCLSYASISAPYLYSRWCTERYGTLCELNHGKS